MKEGKLPVRYLGVPLTSKNLSVNQWNPLTKNASKTKSGLPSFSPVLGGFR